MSTLDLRNCDNMDLMREYPDYYAAGMKRIEQYKMQGKLEL